MERIFIKHQTGSKTNQTEFFSLSDFKGITFGRDSSVDVKYDPDRDDLVSRQHARITRDSNNSGQFILTDLNSRNGTFVNKSRINSPHSLNHGDRVQFGSGGPEFVFELDPSPGNSAKPTRLEQSVSDVQATREIPTETRERKTGQSETRQPGRVTLLEQRIQAERYDMEDLLNDEKQNLHAQLEREKSISRRLLVNVAAGLVFMGVVGAGVFVYQNMQQQKQIIVAQQQLVDAQKTAEQADSEIKAMKEVMTPQKIAEAYSKSTVLIETDWELVDQEGRKVYHQYVDEKKDKKGNSILVPSSRGTIPVYFPYTDEQGNDFIDPTPTFDAEKGRPFSGHIKGTGFAISDQGFILTNNHVASPWKYLDGSQLDTKNGAWYDAKSNSYKRLTSEQINKLKFWRVSSSLLYKNLGALLVHEKEYEKAKIEGRQLALNVTFPKTMLPFKARLVRESNEADVALLKIDILEELQTLPSLDNEGKVAPGEAVTVLGYPSISSGTGTFVVVNSKDASYSESKKEEVPDPTLSSGWVGKVGKIDPDIRIHTDNIYFGETELYQLTINSTGAGNSGGPVFNDRGQVIGLFTYVKQQGGITVSYAIPIKYGYKLKLNRSDLQ